MTTIRIRPRLRLGVLGVSSVPETFVVLVGPITGNVVLPDGSQVDVTPAVVHVGSQAEALAVADAVSQRYVEEGHPDQDHKQFVYDQAPAVADVPAEVPAPADEVVAP